MWKKIKKAFKKVVQAVRTAVTQAVSVVKEIINWVPGVVDFVANLLGLLLWKKIRVSVLILREEHGPPVIKPAEAEGAIKETERIFRKLRVKMVPAGPQYISTVGTPAPTAALEPPCQSAGAAWQHPWLRIEHATPGDPRRPADLGRERPGRRRAGPSDRRTCAH